MKTIVYIGDFKISIMDAQSQLVLGNCKILSETGCTPILIGNDSALSKQDPLASRTKIEGFDCYNIAFNKSLGGLLRSKQFHHQVEAILSAHHNICAIICYGSPAFAVELWMLSSWCKKKKIPMISNCVDLSSTAHGKIVERIVKTIDQRLRQHIVCKKSDGIISVSKYIDEYYQQRTNCPTVILPPLRDTRLIKEPVKQNNEKKTIVYTGVPFPVDGRAVEVSAYKDRIDLMIDLLCSVRDRVPPFQFDIYGLTKEQYLGVVTRHKELLEQNEDCICFHGREPHEEVTKAVGEADYSVMYRVRNQMTMAGFSTKLAESISCGTPVLFTDTSDYKDYLKIGTMGFMLDEEVTDHNREVISEALSVSSQKMYEMKLACYAAHIFDYRNYIETLRKFITNIEGKNYV